MDDKENYKNKHIRNAPISFSDAILTRCDGVNSFSCLTVTCNVGRRLPSRRRKLQTLLSLCSPRVVTSTFPTNIKKVCQTKLKDYAETQTRTWTRSQHTISVVKISFFKMTWYTISTLAPRILHLGMLAVSEIGHPELGAAVKDGDDQSEEESQISWWPNSCVPNVKKIRLI